MLLVRHLRKVRVAAVALGLLVMTAAGPAPAQDQPQRVRGEIVAVDGRLLSIKTREGESLDIRLADDARLSAVVAADLAAIKQGTFIGTAALPQSDGTLLAQEILVFPEAMRGVGEGHRPWDLTPESTMTNATVDIVVTRVDGPRLTLTYPGGEKTLTVTAGTPIVTLEPGDDSLLRPGNHVFLTATRQADGTLEATRAAIGKDGLTPPM